MKIGIVGWGVEGQSAYKYFGQEHEYLIVNEEPRDDFPEESEKVQLQFINDARTPGLTGNVKELSYLDGIETCDKIVYSVTAYPNLEQKFGSDTGFWSKATTVNHIFFETVKTTNIIGITGTKGKGTTSTLTTKILEAAGKTVFLGGNIGRSVLDFVNNVKPDDWVVLEMSNFQLHKFPYSPHIAVCLMITAEHLDWHIDMAEYIAAKQQLFTHQKPDDIAIYFADNDNSKKIASVSAGKKIPYFAQPGALVQNDEITIDNQALCKTNELKLLGKHNWQNVCAAVTAAWQVTQDVVAIRSALTSFSGLEHRLELVRELHGVKYYDDSFATTPEASAVAVEAFTEPKVVILGGHDKGLDLAPLVQEVVSNNVRCVIAIGETAAKVVSALKAEGFTATTTVQTNISDIVAAAQSAAQPGDVVLLSTGYASFGLFKDYKDRGIKFKQAVLALD